jgi:hypothetical protein
MRKLGVNERDMDGPNEFASGEVEDPIARTIIAIALRELMNTKPMINEHQPVALFPLGELVFVGVRGRKLGSVIERIDHGVTSNIKVIRTAGRAIPRARGVRSEEFPLGRWGLLLTKRMEGKGKNDMHETWGMVDPILNKILKGE